MKEYYYLSGKEQKGPFTLEELNNNSLTNETLVWTEGMENWKPLKNIEELNQINRKIVPPPIPNETNKENVKVISGNVKLSPNIQPIDKKVLFWVIAWCGIHLFALVTSYSRLAFFSSGGEPKTDEFWPFVKIFYHPYSNFGGESDLEFQGLFVDYDWSEFVIYVGIGFIIYALVRISKNKNVS